MPQFDSFIFASSLTYFLFYFLTLLYGISLGYLPQLSSILKLRTRLVIAHVPLLPQRSLKVVQYD